MNTNITKLEEILIDFGKGNRKGFKEAIPFTLMFYNKFEKDDYFINSKHQFSYCLGKSTGTFVFYTLLFGAGIMVYELFR